MRHPFAATALTYEVTVTAQTDICFEVHRHVVMLSINYQTKLAKDAKH